MEAHDTDDKAVPIQGTSVMTMAMMMTSILMKTIAMEGVAVLFVDKEDMMMMAITMRMTTIILTTMIMIVADVRDTLMEKGMRGEDTDVE